LQQYFLRIIHCIQLGGKGIASKKCGWMKVAEQSGNPAREGSMNPRRRHLNNMNDAINKNLQLADDISYKFNEDKILEELKLYIDSTYDQHYATDTNLQAIDVFTALGSVITTSRDNAIKYLMRFGKKEGMNRNDIIKVIHYMFFILNEMEKK